ncbi:mucin-13 [Monodelphis domestica]|uniref:mucin-13 n=1 Tax=Monodelphis domestica TaxID=13616 RepID=UPI0024E21787|nr:mucin-13 [Monodelphis domestica]
MNVVEYYCVVNNDECNNQAKTNATTLVQNNVDTTLTTAPSPQTQTTSQTAPTPTPSAQTQTTSQTTATPTPSAQTQTTSQTTATPTPSAQTQTTSQTTATPTPSAQTQTTSQTTATPTPSAQTQTTSQTTAKPTPSAQTQTTSQTTATPTPSAQTQTTSQTTATPTPSAQTQTTSQTTATPTPSAQTQTISQMTATPTTPSAQTQTISQTPAPTPESPCMKKNCGGDSSCIELNSEAYCQCSEGYYYNESMCYEGKTFLGTITVQTELSGLDDKKSQNYQNLYFSVQRFFEAAFSENNTYGQTIILDLQTFGTTRSVVRSRGQAAVTVTNIFEKNSEVNEADVTKAIEEQLKINDTFFYETKNTCDLTGCLSDCTNGLQCPCQQDLARPASNPSSFCSVCSSTCNKESHQQCIKDPSALLPKCQCLPGYIRKGNGKCQECDFGYGGVDCKDNYLLVLTVVCSVGGAILLGTIIALIVISSKKKKKSSEEDSLISSDSANMRMGTLGFSNLGASNGSLFPKVTATQYGSNQSNGRSNPYEDHFSPRSVPARDY